MSATKEFHHDEIEQGQQAAIADTRDYPILFDTQMVKAILSGEKTQTRRLFKSPLSMAMEPAHEIRKNKGKWIAFLKNGQSLKYPVNCPYGEAGDLLWVKETWAPAITDIAYKADYDKSVLSEKPNQGIWHPSIHMPKSAARIWLQITGVEAQRVQSISEEDAKAEGAGVAKIFGFSPVGQCNFRDGFFAKWISIYGIESWYENPWVWAVKFNVLPAVQNKPYFNNTLQTL
jgi:hypothetical protein